MTDLPVCAGADISLFAGSIFIVLKTSASVVAVFAMAMPRSVVLVGIWTTQAGL